MWNIASLQGKKKTNNKEWPGTCKEYERIMFHFVIMEKYGFPVKLNRKKVKNFDSDFLVLVH